MNQDGGNFPRTTALLTAVGPNPTAAAMFLRPMASANSDAVVMAHDYPQFVEECNATIGGLKKSSRPLNYPTSVRGIEMVENTNTYSDIGNRLYKIRTAFSDLNQKEWADKHVFQATQWNNWELGSRRIPIERAEKLCALYGLTLDFIYLGRRDGLSEKASKLL